MLFLIFFFKNMVDKLNPKMYSVVYKVKQQEVDT